MNKPYLEIFIAVLGVLAPHTFSISTLVAISITFNHSPMECTTIIVSYKIIAPSTTYFNHITYDVTVPTKFQARFSHNICLFHELSGEPPSFFKQKCGRTVFFCAYESSRVGLEAFHIFYSCYQTTTSLIGTPISAFENFLSVRVRVSNKLFSSYGLLSAVLLLLWYYLTSALLSFLHMLVANFQRSNQPTMPSHKRSFHH